MSPCHKCILLAGVVFTAGTYAFAQSRDVAPPRQGEDIEAEPAGAGIKPMSADERFAWFAGSTAGPTSLFTGLISAGWGTLLNRPHEYDPHWDGFGKRYGMRLTGISTSKATEASLGALWGEDPRYNRAAEGMPFGGRVRHVVIRTFTAPNRNGDIRPAYARYIAVTGTNFLSNTWREESEADTRHALERVMWGFAGHMAGNAWREFWPSAKQRFFHRAPKNPDDLAAE